MIVRDEDDTLARCLDSVQDVFDEIVIVDTGSTDRTKEVASRFTPNVLDFAWTDDLPRPATTPSATPPPISSCGWTPTTCCCRPIGPNSWS